MMLFLYPWFFLTALFAVPVIILYIFRRRSKRRVVSSLMFWNENRKSVTSGRVIDRLPVPLSLILEILIILLLAGAAAFPVMKEKSNSPDIAFILDDSFSMRAGESREKARSKIMETASEYSESRFFFFLAGRSTRTAGECLYNRGKFDEILKEWECKEREAEIVKSITFAKKVLPAGSRITVITDNLPEKGDIPPGVKWISIGEPLPNTAFVNAGSSMNGGRDKCLIEIANISDSDREEKLVLKLTPFSGRETGRIPEEKSRKIVKEVLISADSVKKLTFEFKRRRQIIEAELSRDALEYDNKVLFVNSPPKVLKVYVNINSSLLRRVVLKALPGELIKIVKSEQDADLIFSDSPEPESRGRKCRRFIIHPVKKENAVFYKSPFIIDRSSPVTDAVYPDGVVWSASGKVVMPGIPLIQTVSAVLLSVEEKSDLSETLHLQISPEYTSLFRSPAWPVLIWNVVADALKSLPGPEYVTYHSGGVVKINLPENCTGVRVTDPDGVVKDYKTENAFLALKVEKTGIWRADAGGKNWLFAVNGLSYKESDLRGLRPGEINNWGGNYSGSGYYRNIAWIFLVCAVVLLVLHLFVTTVPGRGRV